MSKFPVDGLRKVLANTYLLYLKTQNYHWNVAGGAYFKTLHELFETHYEELADAVDIIAERIRQLGEKTPASFTEFNKYKLIDEGRSDKTSQDMLSELLADQKTLVTLIKEVWQQADDAGDEGTADILVGRLRAHEKAAWFYSSSLG
jgi:starvation-inducible DNA-binding protein